MIEIIDWDCNTPDEIEKMTEQVNAKIAAGWKVLSVDVTTIMNGLQFGNQEYDHFVFVLECGEEQS